MRDATLRVECGQKTKGAGPERLAQSATVEQWRKKEKGERATRASGGGHLVVVCDDCQIQPAAATESSVDECIHSLGHGQTISC